jgi:DNA-binding NarL/FixJ family response regulator
MQHTSPPQAAQAPPVAFALSPRQADVFRLISLTNKGIANALHLGEGTVKVHLAAVFAKTGMNRRGIIAAKAAVASNGGSGDARHFRTRPGFDAGDFATWCGHTLGE